MSLKTLDDGRSPGRGQNGKGTSEGGDRILGKGHSRNPLQSQRRVAGSSPVAPIKTGNSNEEKGSKIMIKSQPLVKKYREQYFRLNDLHTMEFVEESLTLSKKRQHWDTILQGFVLAPVIVHRKVKEGSITESVIDGKEMLCYLQTFEKGFINPASMSYNEDGRGVPLKLIHDPCKFFEWHRDTYAPSLFKKTGEHNVCENLRNYLLDLRVWGAVINDRKPYQ